jgi:hypothetical protein
VLPVCPAQFDINQKTALVQYPETHEEEWINLIELVQERCIAVGEWGCSRRHAWNNFVAVQGAGVVRRYYGGQW